jgi:hypothetical protein
MNQQTSLPSRPLTFDQSYMLSGKKRHENSDHSSNVSLQGISGVLDPDK